MTHLRQETNKAVLLIDGALLDRPWTGMGRYALEVVRRLSSHIADAMLLCPDSELLRFRESFSQMRLTRGALWSLHRQRVLWKTIRTVRPSGIYYPTYVPAMMSPRTPFLFTLHDLNPATVARNGLTLSLFTHLVKAAAAIITDSETSRKEIVATFGMTTNKVHVVYPGVSEPAETAPLPPGVAALPQYILYVGNERSHKNVSVLQKAAVRAGIHLVMTGDRPRDEAWGIATGPVDDASLESLYQSALMVAMPSIYEGFGLPIVEAQRRAKPVVASDIPVFREIAGPKGCMFVDPYDSDAWVTAIARLATSKEARAAVGYAGYENAQRYTWDATASRVTEILKVAL